MTGIGEILFIVSLVVVVFGFKHLPKIGGHLGRTISQFKKGIRGEDDDRKTREINPKD